MKDKGFQPFKVRACLRLQRIRYRRLIRHLSDAVAKRNAQIWTNYYKFQYQSARWKHHHGAYAFTLTVVVMLAASALTIPQLERLFESYLAQASNIDLLRSVLLTLGGALFGASAIVSSLVLFSIQVNIDRLPHGLFRRFGADPLLLGAFAGTFILSLCVLALTLMPMPQFGALAFYISTWATILILLLFLFSYRRSLALVNPAKQLNEVVSGCRRDIKMWARRAERARPLWAVPNIHERPHIPYDGKEPDMQKAVYLNVNSHWTREAKKGVAYAASFARRYAEQGDYEISHVALNSVCTVVQDYVAAKEGTFFGQHFIVDNPLSTDGFINDTLEHLRQLSNLAIARGDEQLSEQVLSLLSALVHILCGIDYGRAGASKTHAHLAAAYLSGTVQKIVPLQMTDVLMHGLRMMGQSALILLASEGPNAATTLTHKIGTISAVGIINRELQPVTITGVKELAAISYNLLLYKNGDIGFAARDIRETVKVLAEYILSTEEYGFPGNHSSLLAPYYSGTTNAALAPQVLALVQSLWEKPEDSEEARTILNNLADWSHQIYDEERSLFQLAIQKQSKSISDHIGWISNISKALLVGATSPACSAYARDQLLANSNWLISTFDWVPDDEAAIAFIERHHLTEELLDLSMTARQLECFNAADSIDRLLLTWGVKAAVYRNGRNTLADALCSILASRLLFEQTVYEFNPLSELSGCMVAGAIGDFQRRREIAEELRTRAQTLGMRMHGHSRIHAAMEQVNPMQLRLLLEQAATILDPNSSHT